MAFLISRYLFKSLIEEQIKSSEWLSQNFKLFDEIISTEGAKVVALLRLTYAPFGITSYLIGVSSIGLKDYLLGNVSFIFNCCTHCFIGVSLYTTKNHPSLNPEHDKTITRITLLVEICLTVIVTILIGYLAKNLLE